jgi:hypothetical protein
VYWAARRTLEFSEFIDLAIRPILFLGRVIGFWIKKDNWAPREFELKRNTDEIAQFFSRIRFCVSGGQKAA